jgi:hypothetical protein
MKSRKQSHSQQPQKIKYLGINLTNNAKDLHQENYKAMEKGIREDTTRWNDLPWSWIGRMNILKMLYWKLNAIYIKILKKFITEIKKKT